MACAPAHPQRSLSPNRRDNSLETQAVKRLS